MLLSYEQLFSQTVKDLRSKIANGTTYDLIRSCGLCRHLISDNHPLVHAANRRYKLAIDFEVSDFSDYLDPDFLLPIGWATIEPVTPKTRLLQLSDFLHVKILKYYEHTFNVNEVIRAASHWFGGIHSGKPELPKEATLEALDKAAHTDEKLTIRAIRAIPKVVLTSMESLEKVIDEHTPADGFSPQSSAA
jgi:hypothetical protein